MIIEPPGFIIFAARLAASTKLKAEMFIAVRKPSRVVFSTKLPFNSSLLAKAMEWTRKSSSPKRLWRSAKAASIEASSVTSQGMKSSTPMASPSGRTRFSMSGR